MATPEFYAGHWEVKTHRNESDEAVVPVNGMSIILMMSGTSAEGISFAMTWIRKDHPDLNLIGLQYKDGRVCGEAFDPQNPQITRAVNIYQLGETDIEADIGPWSNANELVGIWGAEKAGTLWKETSPLRSEMPVPAET